MPIDVEKYNQVKSVAARVNGKPDSGEQELFLAELFASFDWEEGLYIPFSSKSIEKVGRMFDVRMECSYVQEPTDNIKISKHCSTMYFGTPTIVNNKPLFRGSPKWSLVTERFFVKALCAAAKEKKYKTILSGLGSGDISPEQRISNMGGGDIICFKDFGDFQDWLIERKL